MSLNNERHFLGCAPNPTILTIKLFPYQRFIMPLSSRIKNPAAEYTRTADPFRLELSRVKTTTHATRRQSSPALDRTSPESYITVFRTLLPIRKLLSLFPSPFRPCTLHSTLANSTITPTVERRQATTFLHFPPSLVAHLYIIPLAWPRTPPPFNYRPFFSFLTFARHRHQAARYIHYNLRILSPSLLLTLSHFRLPFGT